MKVIRAIELLKNKLYERYLAHRIEKSSYFYFEGKRMMEDENHYLALNMLNKSLKYWVHHKPYHLISKIYNDIGDKDRSFIMLRKAYELSGVQDGIASDYAEALIERGNTDEAKEILKTILERNGTFKRAKYLLDRISKTP